MYNDINKEIYDRCETEVVDRLTDLVKETIEEIIKDELQSTIDSQLDSIFNQIYLVTAGAQPAAAGTIRQTARCHFIYLLNKNITWM